jgi:hypothetical protein
MPIDIVNNVNNAVTSTKDSGRNKPNFANLIPQHLQNNGLALVDGAEELDIIK